MTIRIAVSGVPGRLASAVAAGIDAAPDLELSSVFNPHRGGQDFLGRAIAGTPAGVTGDVVFESTEPTVVMENLRAWREAGMAAVVATSGFTVERLDALRTLWGADGPGCIVVPNFAIGAVLMMRFAEQAAPFFSGVEIVERHHHDKPDAPSGTSIATAARIAAAGGASTEHSRDLVPGARGAAVSGVRIHSLRMHATLSDQEVAFSKAGELLSVRHEGNTYEAFVDGALLAMRFVTTAPGVTVGLDAALDWWAARP